MASALGTMQFDEDENTANYRWEQANLGWSAVQEDAEGNIISVNTERDRASKAKRQRVTESVRRGLIRYLVLALDCSSSSLETDFRPCRFEASRAVMRLFIREYFDQNPISQLSLVATRYRNAEKISELSANPRNHEHKLSSLMAADAISNAGPNLASLDMTIRVAMSTLKHIPEYGHREVLIIYNSLSTTDSHDIFDTLELAKKHKVRISFICLAAEVYVCRNLAEETGGQFSVATDPNHLLELLMSHTVPPPELQSKSTKTTDLIYMGFPKRTFDKYPMLGYDGKHVRLFSTSHVCPTCYTRTLEIPAECTVCRLQLNSSSHIARSHHHLFPVPNFVEILLRVQMETDVTSSGEGGNLNLRLQGKRIRPPPPLTPGLPNNVNDNATSSSRGSDGSNANGNGNSNANDNDGDNDDDWFPVRSCRACLDIFTASSVVMQCPLCNHVFCVDCDLFIHDSLHNCPGCA